MQSIYLSAGKNRFVFTGTKTIPVSSIIDNILAAYTPATSIDVLHLWNSYSAKSNLGSFYHFEPNKTYTVYTLSAFNFNFE
jgi:hypothetical protein